ncbi:MAG: hypothetical protein C0402_05355 [Thermodesulfovibrio sp.]|nr:hypothetical protein [Thermodesulfovibrio sp.]
MNAYKERCNLRLNNVLIWIGLFSSLSISLYWILWNVIPSLVQTFSPDSPQFAQYVAYQNSFLMADTWLAVSALLGAVGLNRRKAWGLLFMVIGASSAIFLGLMDLIFDLQHGVFDCLSAAAATEGAIVLTLLSVGPLAIVLSWMQGTRCFGVYEAVCEQDVKVFRPAESDRKTHGSWALQ